MVPVAVELCRGGQVGARGESNGRVQTSSCQQENLSLEEKGIHDDSTHECLWVHMYTRSVCTSAQSSVGILIASFPGARSGNEASRLISFLHIFPSHIWLTDKQQQIGICMEESGLSYA